MKIHKNIKKWGLIGIFIFAAMACTDNFEETNTNKSKLIASQLGEAEIAQMFTAAEYKAISFGIHWKYQLAKNLFADLYAQYFATSKLQFRSDRYFMNEGWLDICWNSFYGEPVRAIMPIVQLTKEKNNDKALAVAQIWKVFTFIPITDQWGAVPYSQAGNGLEQVAYDTQEAIYSDFFTTLEEAVTVLDNYKGETVFADGDKIYNGNIDQWIKFANTLRLRLALRISDVNPTQAKAVAEAAVVSGVIETYDDRAEFPADDNFLNELNRINAWGGEFRMSAAMESVLKGFSDPRLPEFFSVAEETGDYDGLTNGLTPDEMNTASAFKLSLLGPRFDPVLANTNNMIVISSSESYFLRAEGTLLGWSMNGTTEDLYEKGIELSLQEWGISDPSVVSSYISSLNTPVAPDDYAAHAAISDIPVSFDVLGTTERQLEQIITQKWIALFPDGFEAWSEFRRTGYPKLYNVQNSENTNVGTDDFIKRLDYPAVEKVQNAEEYQKGVGLLNGADNIATRVWWDMN